MFIEQINQFIKGETSMTKQHAILTTLLSVLFILANTPIIHSAPAAHNAVKKEVQHKPSEFHGIKTGLAEDLLKLETEYHTLTDTWVKTKTFEHRINKLYYVFGTRERPAAERELQSLLTKYKSTYQKLGQQAKKCKEKLESNIQKTEKKLARMKNPTSAISKKKKQSMQDELAKQQSMLKTAESIYGIHARAIRPKNQFQRMKIDISEMSAGELITKYPEMIKLRLKVQDNIADIEKIQKLMKTKSTYADKQKLKQAQIQLKSNYTKLLTTAEAKKKILNQNISKLDKQIATLNDKIERTEKAKRSTDKIDDKKMKIVMDRNILQSDVDVIDKATKTTKAEKLIAAE